MRMYLLLSEVVRENYCWEIIRVFLDFLNYYGNKKDKFFLFFLVYVCFYSLFVRIKNVMFCYKFLKDSV